MLSRVAAAFHGDVAALVNQLLSDPTIDAEELARVRKLVDRKARELKEKN
jgi:hypothetical protein